MLITTCCLKSIPESLWTSKTLDLVSNPRVLVLICLDLLTSLQIIVRFLETRLQTEISIADHLCLRRSSNLLVWSLHVYLRYFSIWHVVAKFSNRHEITCDQVCGAMWSKMFLQWTFQLLSPITSSGCACSRNSVRVTSI